MRTDAGRWVLVLLASTFFACESREDGQTTIVLTGSSTVAPLMTEIGRRYEEQHPGVRVDVQAGGSSRGVADARSGLAQIGMASRELTADEQDLVAYPIASDGVTVILHRDNPVKALTQEQLLEIYLGRARNWKAFGGPDSEITVVTKAEGRSTRELFLDYLGIESPEIHADVIIGHNEQGIQTVAGNPAAIGFVSIGTAAVDVERGVAIRLLPLDGIPATLEAVSSGTFPISRPLNLVVPRGRHGDFEDLIRFARSEQVHDLVRAQAFVPIQP
ncbi:MAG: phosphate ABC transporter substrate-binding protein [Planctomycetota bacterium]